MLNDKQKKFCEEYMLDYNATQAAIRSGYSKKTAQQMGSENLLKPVIQTYIEELKGKLSELSGVTALRNINELAKIAYKHPADIFDDDGELKFIKDMHNPEQISGIKKTSSVGDSGIRTSVEIKTYDKLKAIETLNKMLGLNAPDTLDINDSSEKVIKVIYERVDNKTEGTTSSPSKDSK